MLRLSQPQLSLWDSILPEELRTLSPELKRVNELLDDPRFVEPFGQRFRERRGRPTVPVDTFLRLIYLKHRHDLSYERLVEGVRDSIMWRRFCRIPLDGEVPHSTTLVKLVKKYGPEVMDELNEALVEQARERKVIRGKRLRVDTTAVESNIHYPTDASLLADGVRVLRQLVHRVQAEGLATRTHLRDRTRSIKRRLLGIQKVLRRRTGQAYDEVRAITQEVLEIAEKATTEARRLAANARKTLRRKAGQIGPEQIERRTKAVAALEEMLTRTEQVIDQTWQVQEGIRSIPERLVSLFDPDARPIVRGKLNKRVEFGYKLVVQEVEHGIISGYEVLVGNPPDEEQLLPAFERHQRTFKNPPRQVAVDRGMGRAANERALEERGVVHPSLPRKGRLTQERRVYESQAWFRHLQRWRAGIEGRISTLKRQHGLGRARVRGRQAVHWWVGAGIFAQNLKQLARV